VNLSTAIHSGGSMEYCIIHFKQKAEVLLDENKTGCMTGDLIEAEAGYHSLSLDGISGICQILLHETSELIPLEINFIPEEEEVYE